MPQAYDLSWSSAELAGLFTRVADGLAAENLPAEEHANAAEVLLHKLAMRRRARPAETPYSSEVWSTCFHFLAEEVAAMEPEEGIAFAMYLLADMLAGDLDASPGQPPRVKRRPPIRETRTGTTLRAVA